MKKPYQIESQRAVRRWEEMAAQEGAALRAAGAAVRRGLWVGEERH